MKQGKQIGWKVITTSTYIDTDQYKYESATNHASNIEYKIGEWVTPLLGNGPLSVWATKEAALNFANYYHKTVFKCEYYPSTHDKIWYIENLSWYVCYGITDMCYGPDVRLASTVKLLEEVW